MVNDIFQRIEDLNKNNYRLACENLNLKKELEEMSHAKIEKKAAKALERDADKYAKEAKHAKSPIKKKHEKVEEKEARSAAKDLKSRARKAHEYG